MANIPRPRTGIRPVSGSVGRQRINAPLAAFGGGSGLADLGRGVASLGSGLEEHQQRKDKEAAVEADLAVVDRMDRWYSDNSLRKGPNARTLVTEFDKMLGGSVQELTKNLSPNAKRIVELANQKSAQRYRRQLMGIESRELNNSEKINAQIGLKSKVQSAVNSIGTLEHYSGDYDAFFMDHQDELLSKVNLEADKEQMTDEQRDDHLKKRVNEFHFANLNRLLKNIEINEDIGLEGTKKDIDAYKQTIEFSDLNDAQKGALSQEADKVFKRKRDGVKARQVEFRNLELKAQGKVAEDFESSVDQNGATSWSWDKIEAANMSTSAKRYAKNVWRSSNDKKKKASESSEEVQESAQTAVDLNKQISAYNVTADMDRSEWAHIMTAIDSMPSNLSGTKTALKESLKAKTMAPFDNKDTLNVVIDNLKDVYKLDKPELNKFFAIDEENLDKRMAIYGAAVSNLRASAKDMTKSQFAIEVERVIKNANETVKSDEAVTKSFNNLTKKPEVVDTTERLAPSELTGAPTTTRIKFKGQPAGTRPIQLKDGTRAWYNITTGDITPIKKDK